MSLSFNQQVAHIKLKIENLLNCAKDNNLDLSIIDLLTKEQINEIKTSKDYSSK
jgi:hypothetical protein